MRAALPLLAILSFSCGNSGPDATPPDNNDYIDPADFVCVSDPAPQFTAYATDLDLIPFIVPLGTASGNEIKNRTYVHTGAGNRVPVYAPVDAVLTGGAYKGPTLDASDYRLDFTASCEIAFTLDHITEPAEKIRSVYPATPSTSSVGQQLSSFVIVRAGELIGYTTGTQQAGSWDFAVFDSGHRNVFINGTRYETTPNLWGHLHARCPYDLYPADMRDAQYALFADPGGTRVDGAGCRSASRDIAGALSGQWFLDVGAGAYDGQIAIAKELTGDVRLALGTNPSGIGSMIIGSGGSGYADPENTAVTEHCYSDVTGYAFFRIESGDTTQMDVHVSSGSCPASFPTSGYVAYSR